MNKMFFLRHYGILLSAKSVLIDTDVAELTYQAYRNDFTNEEFAAVCLSVLKNENFYGRPPDPAIFAKYVKAAAAEIDFIAKCVEYLRRDYVSATTREAFVEDLTEREKRTLYSFGGILTLWSVCHPNGIFNPDRFDFKLKALRDAFGNEPLTGQKRLPKPKSEKTKQIEFLSKKSLRKSDVYLKILFLLIDL